MRASLSDLADFGSKNTDDDNGPFEFGRRERSASNDKFDLPPLPDMDDNKDLGALEEPESLNFKGNYRSNEGGKSKNQPLI